MLYSFDNERPIYIQLVECLKLMIISQEYKSGAKIPSVRDLAMTFKVNPNTMQKALSEIENDGLIYTERTNGKFVTKDKKKIDQYRNELALQKTGSYLKEMAMLGLNKEEIIEYLKKESK